MIILLIPLVLNRGELKAIFSDWEVIFYFEGIKTNPERAIAQIVCQKPCR